MIAVGQWGVFNLLLLMLLLVLPFRPASSAGGTTTVPFRPPATPLITFAPMQQKFILGHEISRGQSAAYWDGTPLPLTVLVRVNRRATFVLVGNPAPAEAIFANQIGMPRVLPTTTAINFTVACSRGAATEDEFILELLFVSPMLPDNLDLLARPAAYIVANAFALGEAAALPACLSHLSLYVDASPAHAVHLMTSELVTWDAAPRWTMSTQSVRLGTVAQSEFQSYGDDFLLDWGYMHLVVPRSNQNDSSLFAGDLITSRQAVVEGYDVLPPIDPFMPTMSTWTAPGLAAVVSFTIAAERRPPAMVLGAESNLTVVFAYQTEHIQYYFGALIPPRWKYINGSRSDITFQEAVVEPAVASMLDILHRAQRHDAELWHNLTDRFGVEFAQIASLAYRQVFAAIELGYGPSSAPPPPSRPHLHDDVTDDEPWAFLKEISSDGDVNTMDVIFPASPLLLYVNPTLLRQLLIPVLRYAANQTWIPFAAPYSPHQLGVYPVSNCTKQEIMPLENSGNMFLMLLAYVRQTNETDLFFLPYFDLLRTWADYMLETQLPDPPMQICTDDFAGPLAHNANLAAKGVIAIRAFADLCALFNAHGGTPTRPIDCQHYLNASFRFADYWVTHGVEDDGNEGEPISDSGHRHSKLAFNLNGTWSTKYNLLWQRLLGFHDEPFVSYSALCEDEVRYYSLQLNTYGFPMDCRHTYQKLDWMTWGSLLSPSKSTFVDLFRRVHAMANATHDRWPLTDLYDTVTADIVYYFRSRPVVGAVFAAMLIDDWSD